MTSRSDTSQSERRYPTFGPEDDDFHDEVLTDRWWETETQWFSWNIPERKMGGWVYSQARPNANLCNGGVWVWDDTGSYAWELPYHVHYSGLRLPPRPERDLRDFRWPTGAHVRVQEPLSRYEIDYADEGGLQLQLVFDAIMAPNPHPLGVAPFQKGIHFDQAGHLTGEMALEGERIAIDCYSVRDRSWGPRPAGPSRKAHDWGVGYSFGTASPDEAFLVYSIPSAAEDTVTCGYLIRNGIYAHILDGSRTVVIDADTGFITHMTIDAVDDAGRSLHAIGNAVSRHWQGRGGDTLLHWSWDGAAGWGEDQSRYSKGTWKALR
jgi:hypothetical protein